MTAKQILDKVNYQKGNIILAANIPTKSTGQSQELKMTVHGVYYVTKVTPTHLQVTGVFTGEERNFPHEHCEKIHLDNLSKLQFQLENLQLQKVSDNFFI